MSARIALKLYVYLWYMNKYKNDKAKRKMLEQLSSIKAQKALIKSSLIFFILLYFL